MPFASRPLLVLAAGSVLASCAVMPPRPPLAAGFPRHDTTAPFEVIHLFHAEPATTRALVALQDDHTLPFRGLRRAGDGSLSIGLKGLRGGWMRGHECGGILMFEGRPGQQYMLVLKNETHAPMEIAAGSAGRDWLAEGPFAVNGPGFLLKPLETRSLPAPGAFPSVPAPTQPLTLFRAEQRPGAIIIAVHHKKDEYPWEAERPLATRPTARKFPQRRFVPGALPHVYR